MPDDTRPGPGRTFPVASVDAATTPLPEVPYKEAAEALLRPTVTKREQAFLNSIGQRRGMLAAGDPSSSGMPRVEACSRYHSRLLADIAYHPFMAAVHECFDGHHPLCLSPDMIWLLIAQGVANHIHANAEELRSNFVRHAGEIAIEIRRDDFHKGSPENPWPEMFSQLAEAVGAHVGPARDLLRCEFSTTTPVELAALDVTWLDAMRPYFRYMLRSRCGIPEITLEGTPDDWRMIRDRIGGFTGLGLDWWWDALRPILGQFEAASRGDVDTGFWKSIYRLRGESGGPYITGWSAAFFPYLKDDETNRPTRRNGYLLAVRDDPGLAEIMLRPGEAPGGGGPAGRGRSSGGHGTGRRWSGAEGPAPGAPGHEPTRPAWEWGWTSESLPGSLSRAPFHWMHELDDFSMELLGGFVGVSQCPDTLALRPEIGWAVRPCADV